MKACDSELQTLHCGEVYLALPSSDPDAIKESLKGDL